MQFIGMVQWQEKPAQNAHSCVLMQFIGMVQ